MKADYDLLLSMVGQKQMKQLKGMVRDLGKDNTIAYFEKKMQLAYYTRQILSNCIDYIIKKDEENFQDNRQN